MYFFVTLGVIFFGLLLASAYVWFMDPFNIRSLVPQFVPAVQISEQSVDAQHSPELRPEQAALLERLDRGDDIAFSEVEIECFIDILGSSRVAEIEAGDTPSLSEIWSVRTCLE